MVLASSDTKMQNFHRLFSFEMEYNTVFLNELLPKLSITITKLIKNSLIFFMDQSVLNICEKKSGLSQYPRLKSDQSFYSYNQPIQNYP